MRLRLVELQIEDGQVWNIRVEKLGGNWEDSDRILHHQGLIYISEIIKTKLISRHYNNPLAGQFGIEKMLELVTRKYYSEILYHNIDVYVRGCNIYLVSKTIRHKLYENLQQLLVLTHC